MRVLVLRPEPDASRTAAALDAAGHAALICPVTRIVPVDAALPEGRWAAIALTSAHAADRLGAMSAAARHADTPVYCVGGSTADRARAAGLRNARSVDGRVGDLADRLIADLPPGAAVLYPAGEDRAGDLEGRLQRAGLAPNLVVVYRAPAMESLPETIVSAIAGGTVAVVQAFSARTGAIFIDLADRAGVGADIRRIFVHAMSDDVAAPFARAGFSRIAIATHPGLDGMIKLLAPSREC